jgi:glycosyltransferase involved in cell wall biosynthesis
MPIVLKPPTAPSKGIVVFTHKERPYLEGQRRLLVEARARLRERYVVGMHWGHYAENVDAMPAVDFHLAGPGTLHFKPGIAARRIPLCSRNFTRECFRNLGLPKQWDIINVSRPIRLKNLDQFLLVVRKIYDKGRSPKVLLVCVHPSNMSERDGWYTTLRRDYERLFSADEREHITLLMVTSDGEGFPLPSSMLSFLYNASRCLALFSDQEGESRVIAEALVCGLPVFVKRTLRGGGRDYLDANNSWQFDTLDQASEMFIELMTGTRRSGFDAERYEQELGERFTRLKLATAMRQLFAEMNLEFDGGLDLDDLGRKLPGHVLTLPESLRSAVSNDLRSADAAIRYMRMLSGDSVKAVGELGIRFESAVTAVAARARHAVRSGRASASHVVRWLEGHST